MSKPFRLFLKSGERLYLNGAVLRVDRKVALDLLNDATFLLETHVMKVEETSTPFRQLYFVVQSMLIDPASREAALGLFDRLRSSMRQSLRSEALLGGLHRIEELVAAGREFEALRVIRHLLPVESGIMGLGKRAEGTEGGWTQCKR